MSRNHASKGSPTWKRGITAGTTDMQVAFIPFAVLSFVFLAAQGSRETTPTEAAQPQTTTKASGIKMTVRFETEKSISEQTLYIQSDRRRMDYQPASNATHGDGTLDTRPGPRLAVITRCDLGQEFELNLEDHEYVVSQYPRSPLAKQQVEARGQNVSQKIAPWVPTVREETTTVDIGERKNFFGHVARHVIKTSKVTPLAGSRSEQQETVTDGWYIDRDMSISCDVKWPRRNVGRRHEYFAAGGERYEIIDDGISETGYATESKFISRSTIALPDGTKKDNVYSNEEKITEFHEGVLEAAVFEVPSSFRKVSGLRRSPPMTLSDRWYYTLGWLKSAAKDIF